MKMHTKDRMVQKLAEVRQQPGEKAEKYLERMKKVITQDREVRWRE